MQDNKERYGSLSLELARRLEYDGPPADHAPLPLGSGDLCDLQGYRLPHPTDHEDFIDRVSRWTPARIEEECGKVILASMSAGERRAYERTGRARRPGTGGRHDGPQRRIAERRAMLWQEPPQTPTPSPSPGYPKKQPEPPGLPGPPPAFAYVGPGDVVEFDIPDQLGRDLFIAPCTTGIVSHVGGGADPTSPSASVTVNCILTNERGKVSYVFPRRMLKRKDR